MKLTPEEVLKYFIPRGDRLYVTEEFIIRVARINPKVLKARKSEHKNGKIETWAFIKILFEGREVLVYDFLSIPQITLTKYDFPDLLWLVKHFPPKFQTLCLPEGISASDVELKMDLEKGLKQGEKNLGFFYCQEIHAGTTIVLARKFGILLFAIKYIRELPNNHGLRKRLFEVLQSDEFKHLEFPNNRSTFYGYLLRALRAFEEGEIQGLIKFVKGRYGIPSPALKVNEAVLALVIHYAAHVNPISNKDVLIWVNSTLLSFPDVNGGRIIGQSTIDYLKNKYENRINIRRGGEETIRRTYAPYLSVIQAENPFDQFQFDEWHVEFSTKDGRKIVSLIMLTLMDSASRKTILRRYTESLNSAFLKEFIYDSIELCQNCIAAEYVCDFSSVNASEMMADVFEYFLRKFPGKFFWSPSSEPNRKAILERYFRTVASYLAPFIGWKGFGITSRGNSQPAKVLKLYLTDPKYLDDKQECIRMLENFHDLHNRNGMHLDEPAPNEIFIRNPRPNQINLSFEQMAYAFYTKETRTMSRTTVNFNSREFENFTTAALYCGHDVTCAYDEKRDPKHVYVFKQNTDEFLGDFTLKNDSIHSAKINQTQEDQSKLSSEMEKREKMIEVLNNLGVDDLKYLEQILKVNPGEFVMDLQDSQLPAKSTDVSQITGNKKDQKVELNPFNVKPKLKKIERAGSKKKKAKHKTFKPISNLKQMMHDQ